MSRITWRWIAIIELAMLPGMLSAGALVEKPVAKLSTYARAYDWVPISQPKPGNQSCGALLKDMQKARSLRAIEPRIKAADAFDSALVELSRCSEYKVAERREAAVPNNFIWGPRDLGDQSFRMYRVRPRISDETSRPMDIVYAEYDERKVLTNAYSDAFSIVDLPECKIADSVPVQRPLSGDLSTGATRNVSKGLFEVNGRTYVIATTEQVGHLNDPNSFRAIEAWALEAAGKFLQVCTWAPRSIVMNREQGK